MTQTTRPWLGRRAGCYIAAIVRRPLVTNAGAAIITTERTWLARGLEFARFGGTSLIMLAAKLLLMQVALLIAGEIVGYALVQVVLFFASYVLHSRFTFGTPFSWRSLGRFFRTISLFQLLDWLLFTVIFTQLGIDANLVILVCTVVVFVLRYLFVRRSLREDQRP